MEKSRKLRRRKQLAKQKKSYLPTLILIILLWGLLAGFVYFIDPISAGAIPAFFALFFFALLFTLSFTFANSRRGFLTAAGLTLLMILRYFGAGNILNLLLIIGILITLDVYFSK